MKKILVLIGTNSKTLYVKKIEEALNELEKEYSIIDLSYIVGKDKKEENDQKIKTFEEAIPHLKDIIILQDGFLDNLEQAKYLESKKYEIVILKLEENRVTKEAEKYLRKHGEYYLLTLSQNTKEKILELISEIVSIRK